MNGFVDAAAQAVGLVTTLDPKLVEIVLLSLRVSIAAVVLGCAIGLPIGAAIAVNEFRGKHASRAGSPSPSPIRVAFRCVRSRMSARSGWTARRRRTALRRGGIRACCCGTSSPQPSPSSASGTTSGEAL